MSSIDRTDLNSLAVRANNQNITTGIEEVEIQGTRHWRLQVTGFDSRSMAMENSAIIKQSLGIDNVWIFKEG